MDRLEEAREMVVEDPGIMSGAPVIKGTRVPVYIIAALFDEGTPVDEILSSYPSVKESQIELASVYARAFPAPKRSRKPFVGPGYHKVVERKRLSSSVLSEKPDKTTS